jgi:hypothetical protein
MFEWILVAYLLVGPSMEVQATDSQLEDEQVILSQSDLMDPGESFCCGGGPPPPPPEDPGDE